MPDAASIRPLQDADADMVVALYARAATIDPRLGPVSLADWQRFSKLVQNHDCRDFRVAEQQGRLIGVAESSLKDQGDRKVRFFKLVVDPVARRHGVGLTLLESLLALDAQLDLWLQTLVGREWKAGIAFASALGFVHIESEISMKCVQLTKPLRDAPLDGVLIGRVANVSRCAPELAHIHNSAFASDTAFRLVTGAEMTQLLDGDELWTASRNGKTLGFCQIEKEPHRVWLESIAIDPMWQMGGLGSALAHRALLANKVSSDHPAGLNVSSKNTVALRLYRRLGFLPRHETYRFTGRRSDLLAAIRQRKA